MSTTCSQLDIFDAMNLGHEEGTEILNLTVSEKADTSIVDPSPENGLQIQVYDKQQQADETPQIAGDCVSLVHSPRQMIPRPTLINIVQDEFLKSTNSMRDMLTEALRRESQGTLIDADDVQQLMNALQIHTRQLALLLGDDVPTLRHTIRHMTSLISTTQEQLTARESDVAILRRICGTQISSMESACLLQLDRRAQLIERERRRRREAEAGSTGLRTRIEVLEMQSEEVVAANTALERELAQLRETQRQTDTLLRQAESKLAEQRRSKNSGSARGLGETEEILAQRRMLVREFGGL